MLYNLFFWMIMLWFTICFGFGGKKMWLWFLGNKSTADKFTLDMVIITGVCILNIYAQFFSLFYKVGLIANVVLAVASILLIPIIKEEIRSLFFALKRIKYGWWIVGALILGIMLFSGSLPDDHYDTALYHAQAIRWIEEYGVVKGLGCIHGRLGFNSAFLVLQALFGYGCITGVELHSCNAFLMFIFHIWGVYSLNIWKNGKFVISDAFKLLMLFYIYTCTKVMSSPSTDIFVVAMIIYIVTKWVELIETGDHLAASYAYLSFFALYAATLKLSAAPFGLIILYPLYMMLKERDYEIIWKSVLIGAVIALPFLIRNVILSGWLLYPLPELDFFEVDWKIPKEYVVREKMEIETWGKSLTDIGLHDLKISEWFPMWFQWIGSLWRKIVRLSVIAQALAFLRCIYFIWDKHCIEYKKAMLFIYIIEAVILIMWFITAPSIRFGGIFCMFAGTTLVGEFLNEIKRGKYIYLMIVFVVILLIEYNIYDDLKGKEINIMQPAAYTEYATDTLQKDGVIIYYPTEGDQTGYLCFPSIPGKVMEAELRKHGSLKDGFRMRR